MLCIKYLSRALPKSKLAKWQTTTSKSKFVDYVKAYIFNDFFSLIVHGAIAILFAVGTNLPVNDATYDIIYGAFLYAGVAPLVLTTLPYMIYGILIYPIKKLISWIF